MEINELKKKSCELRKSALKAIAHAGSGHPGGSMSVMDILTVLYYRELRNIDPADPHRVDRDRMVLSKGHANPALWAAACRAIRTVPRPRAWMPAAVRWDRAPLWLSVSRWARRLPAWIQRSI